MAIFLQFLDNLMAIFRRVSFIEMKLCGTQNQTRKLLSLNRSIHLPKQMPSKSMMLMFRSGMEFPLTRQTYSAVVVLAGVFGKSKQ